MWETFDFCIKMSQGSIYIVKWYLYRYFFGIFIDWWQSCLFNPYDTMYVPNDPGQQKLKNKTL